MLFSEPKIPQSGWWTVIGGRRVSFSALQRAENSSMRRRRGQDEIAVLSFSALQRAENSSIYFRERDGRTAESVSVLFSEPKIPQSRPSHLRPSIFPTAMITLRHS